MSKLQMIFASLAFIALSQCTSVQNSNAVKKETKTLLPVKDRNNDLLATAKVQSQTSGRGTEDIIGQGIGLAVSGIKSLINADKKKYALEYDAIMTGEYFYNNISTGENGMLDPTGITFKGLRFVRMAEITKEKVDTAMVATFEVNQDDPYAIVNNSTFEMKLKELRLYASKVKVPSKKWYVPWTWFTKQAETIDLDFDITIRATWLSAGGTFYDNVTVGKFNHTIRKMPLNFALQQQWLKDKGKIGEKAIGYSLLVPRSFSSFVSVSRGEKPTYENAFGKGLYRVDFKVKEATKKSFVMKSFFDKSDSYIDSGVKAIKK